MLRPLQLIATALVLSLGITLAPVTGDQPEQGGRVAAAASAHDAYVIKFANHNIKCQNCGGNWRWRAHRSAEMVRNNNANVVTFQEVGKDQYTILRNQLPGHRFWPRGKYGGSERQTQIAWRRDTFKPVEQGSFWVPGLRHIVPWVRLKDRSTGRRFWVMAVHNAPRNREWERDRATAIQIDKANKMFRRWGNRQEAVFVLGDANERREFCVKFRKNTPLRGMNGEKGNPCPVPPGGPDWMVGNKRGVGYGRLKLIPAFESMHDFMRINARVRPSSKPYWRR